MVIIMMGTLALTACTATPRDVLRRDPLLVDPAVISRVVKDSPASDDQPVRRDDVLYTEECSIHVWQVMTRSERQLHRLHDLIINVSGGDGQLVIGGRQYRARGGDTFHIPRATPYYCVNRGDDPFVAVMVFVPPYDTADTISKPVDAKSYPRGGTVDTPPR